MRDIKGKINFILTKKRPETKRDLNGKTDLKERGGLKE